jgi:hypothetical protein
VAWASFVLAASWPKLLGLQVNLPVWDETRRVQVPEQ